MRMWSLAVTLISTLFLMEQTKTVVPVVIPEDVRRACDEYTRGVRGPVGLVLMIEALDPSSVAGGSIQVFAGRMTSKTQLSEDSSNYLGEGAVVGVPGHAREATRRVNLPIPLS